MVLATFISLTYFVLIYLGRYSADMHKQLVKGCNNNKGCNLRWKANRKTSLCLTLTLSSHVTKSFKLAKTHTTGDWIDCNSTRKEIELLEMSNFWSSRCFHLQFIKRQACIMSRIIICWVCLRCFSQSLASLDCLCGDDFIAQDAPISKSQVKLYKESIFCWDMRKASPEK